jgi:heterodisulfide reductase subunit C
MAIDFGYNIHRDRQIDYDSLSRDLLEKVQKAEPSIKACISCGTCAATCSAAQFTDFSLRKLILLTRRGYTKDMNNMVHKCMLCGKCQIICPMGVNTRNLVLTLQHFTDTI